MGLYLNITIKVKKDSKVIFIVFRDFTCKNGTILYIYTFQDVGKNKTCKDNLKNSMPTMKRKLN